MFINIAYAQDAVAATGGSSSFLMQLAPLLPMVAIFYLFFIRPQRKRATQHQQLISGLKKGDQVITNGGIIASVVKNTEQDPYIIAEIAESMKVRLTREAITGLFSNEKKAEKKVEKKVENTQPVKAKRAKASAKDEAQKK